MKNRPKSLLKGKNILFFLVAMAVSSGIFAGINSVVAKNSSEDPSLTILSLEKLNSVQNNSLLPISNPMEPVATKTIKVVVTAYSSTVWQTDSDPFITASGKMVQDGIVANNLLPFGTKIKIPELYGNKIFVVEDRMHWRKGVYQFDIWFSDYWQAKNFGVKKTSIEILEG